MKVCVNTVVTLTIRSSKPWNLITYEFIKFLPKEMMNADVLRTNVLPLPRIILSLDNTKTFLKVSDLPRFLFGTTLSSGDDMYTVMQILKRFI